MSGVLNCNVANDVLLDVVCCPVLCIGCLMVPAYAVRVPAVMYALVCTVCICLSLRPITNPWCDAAGSQRGSGAGG